MSHQIRLCMAQINPTVGAIAQNVEKILSAAKQAQATHQADMVVFPEMTLTGYPPEDVLFRPALYEQVEQALAQLCAPALDIVMVVGYPMIDELGERFNMAAWIEKGEIQASYIKQHLPNYSVFDEKRYFSTHHQPCVVTFKEVRFGLLICEDIWKFSPAAQAVEAGADMILNLNASPFSQEKHQDRIQTVARRVSEIKKPIVYVNQVGGQDELVFDGGSFATCAEGEVQVQAPEFETALTPVTILKQGASVAIMPGAQAQLHHNEARLYQALCLGVRDYVKKNGFQGVLLGLSGGIDSALTLALAVDALGASQVDAVMMPFHYTAQISQEDAALQAKQLGVAYQSLPIESIYQAFEDSLAASFAGCALDTTEENLQARIRGVLLMALSNKHGKVVLATSNKSEAAVGYTTLYGDMVGGFSPLKDVSKTWVYRLARYRNQTNEAQGMAPVIPWRVIERPHRLSCGRNKRIKTLCLLTSNWTRLLRLMWLKTNRLRRLRNHWACL